MDSNSRQSVEYRRVVLSMSFCQYYHSVDGCTGERTLNVVSKSLDPDGDLMAMCITDTFWQYCNCSWFQVGSVCGSVDAILIARWEFSFISKFGEQFP